MLVKLSYLKLNETLKPVKDTHVHKSTKKHVLKLLKNIKINEQANEKKILKQLINMLP
jgi:hypothetical protein